MKGVSHTLAVIDCGSGKFRMIIYHESGVPLLSYKATIGLGDIDDDEVFATDAVNHVTDFLHECRTLLDTLGVEQCLPVGTAALRHAMHTEAGQQMINYWSDHVIKAPITVISGAEESILAALAVQQTIIGYQGYVMDVGGRSLDLAAIDSKGAPHFVQSDELGYLVGLKTDSANWPALTANFVKKLHAQKTTYKHLCLVGGIYRSLLKKILRSHENLDYDHGVCVSKAMLRTYVPDNRPQSIDAYIKSLAGEGPRDGAMPYALYLLLVVCDTLNIDAVCIAKTSLRDGVFLNQCRPQEKTQRAPSLLSRADHIKLNYPPKAGDPSLEKIASLFEKRLASIDDGTIKPKKLKPLRHLSM